MRQLQERLRQLGYDAGPVDGYFGYLTHDALTAFQRDYGVRADGIAGRQVWVLLEQRPESSRRQAFMLAAGENLEDAARRLGTSAEVLRYMNRLPARARGYPGQRLMYRSHYVVAALPVGNAAGLRTLRSRGPVLSALATPVATISEDGVEVSPPGEEVREAARREGLQLWIYASLSWHLSAEPRSEAVLSALPRRRRVLRAAAQSMTEVATTAAAGVWLDVGQIYWGDGPRLHYLVRLLRETLGEHGHPLMVSVPLPAGRARLRWWLTDIDYEALAKMADWITLATHYPGPLESFSLLVRRLEAVLGVLPRWKTLLGVSLLAQERDTRGRVCKELSYRQAITTSYLLGTRPVWDGERRLLRSEMVPKALNTEDSSASDEERVLWLPGRDAVAERINLVNRLNLAGILLWPIGEEDVRIWDVLGRRLKPERPGV